MEAVHSGGLRLCCVLTLLLLLESAVCKSERGAAALEEHDRDCVPANAEAL